MHYNNRTIVLHELIGLKVRVVRCLDKKQKGLQGMVVDESKNTLVVETRAGTRRVIKKTATFKFYNGDKTYTVDGREINFRPHERLEKGLRFYRQRAPD